MISGLGATSVIHFRDKQNVLSQLLLIFPGALCAATRTVPGGIPRPVSAPGACGPPLPVFLGARVFGSAFCRFGARCGARGAAARQWEAVTKRTSR